MDGEGEELKERVRRWKKEAKERLGVRGRWKERVRLKKGARGKMEGEGEREIE